MPSYPTLLSLRFIVCTALLAPTHPPTLQNEVLWSRYSLERRLMNAQNVVEGANERV